MIVDQMVPDDAGEMLRIARANGFERWHYPPGAYGLVVRDDARVRGFCIVREVIGGFVVENLWGDGTRRGVASLGMLADYLEKMMTTIASERGHTVRLAGTVRNDNGRHKRVLRNRGFTPFAEVLGKDYEPHG